MGESSSYATRKTVERTFQRLDELIYIVVGLFLVLTTMIAVYELFKAVLHYFTHPVTYHHSLVQIIDKIMLTLMLLEILYTVRVSYQSHYLTAEPFLVVGIIAAIRRILVISVESGLKVSEEPEVFVNLLTEIGVLSILVVLFVVSIILLNRYLSKESRAIKVEHS